MPTPAPDTDPLALGRRIIDILQSGKKTSTYKLAVLQALIDCCIERVPDDQHASVNVPLDELTDRVIELYWPQTRPLAWNEYRPLRQASEGSEILDAIGVFREAAKAGPNKLLADAKRDAPDGAYAKAFNKVKRTLVRYPLRLLQNVPGGTDTFLYEDGWIRTNPSLTAIDQPDNMIQLRPGVAFAMAKLSGLLKPALRWLWADKVWKSNRKLFQGGLDVQQYLFEDRIPLTRIGPALMERFDPKCFYCYAKAPQVARFHVDHVLPLSLTKMNGLANLVLACQPCNSSKGVTSQPWDTSSGHWACRLKSAHRTATKRRSTRLATKSTGTPSMTALEGRRVVCTERKALERGHGVQRASRWNRFRRSCLHGSPTRWRHQNRTRNPQLGPHPVWDRDHLLSAYYVWGCAGYISEGNK